MSCYKYVIDKIPVRATIAMWIFFFMFSSPFLQTSFSISLLAMVKTETVDANGTVIEQANYGPRYEWSAYQQGLLLGAVFIGRVCTTLVIGVLVEKFGLTKVALIASLLVGSTIAALFPIAATSFATMYLARFLIGSFGPQMTLVQLIISHWAPVNEKGKFMSMFFGVDIGQMLTMSMTGVIIQRFGWHWAFYIPAICVSFYALISIWIVYDSPADHPRISMAEREYIERGLTGISSGPKEWPPIFRIVTSRPFWALVLLLVGQFWGIYFMSMATPRFLSEILGFNIASTGLLSSLPYVVRLSSGFAFGTLNDWLVSNQKVPKVFIRKGATILSHVIPGIFLVCIPLVSERPNWCIVFVVLSYGFSGASVMGGFINVQELAPNYSSTIMSINNSITFWTGFLSPLLVAYFTKDNNTINEWNSIFRVGALIYIVPAIVFILFGSVQIQSWNESGDRGKIGKTVEGSIADNETEKPMLELTTNAVKKV